MSTVVQGDATNKDWWDKKLFDKILIDAPAQELVSSEDIQISSF